MAAPEAVAQAARLLAQARSPLLLAKAAGRDPGAVAPLVALAERLGAPFVDQFHTYVNFPQDHPLHGGFDAAPYLGDADVIVAVESDVPWFPALKAPRAEARVIQIGVDPLFARYPIRGFRADLAITGEVSGALAQIDLILQKPDSEFTARIGARRRTVAEFRRASGLTAPKMTQAPAAMSAKWVTRCIDDLCDADTVLLNEYPLVLEELLQIKPGNYFSHSPAGGLGWAMGAALGFKLARPDQTVIAALGG